MQVTDAINTSLLLSGSLLVVANFILGQAKAVPTKVKNLVLRWFSVTIELHQHKYPYNVINEYLPRQKAIFKCRNHNVTQSTDNLGRTVMSYFPAPGSFYFWYEGKPAVARRTRRDLENGDSSVAFFETLTIRFFGGTQQTIEKFIGESLKNIDENKNITKIWTSSYGSSYSGTLYRVSRPISTVFLPSGMKEEILEDSRNFFNNSEWYSKLGIPHRRGYLLHGEPGTGKTSIIRGIAGELGLGIVVISLNKKDLDDAGLMSLFSMVPRNSCVILEDIDCLFEKRDGNESRVTLSGLLNAIDGVASSEGYLLFMTTNHPELLDPALTRPGRIDRRFHIGYAEAGQAARYFEHFYGSEYFELALKFGDEVGNRKVTMAEIQNILLLHRDDPEKALETFN